VSPSLGVDRDPAEGKAIVILLTALRRRLGAGQASMSPAVALLNVLLTAGAVFLAAHAGMLPDIAGYSAGVGVVAVAAVLAAGGTTLTFVTGSDEARHAVRRVRTRITVPILVAAALAGAAFYGETSDVSPWSVLLGGITVAATNLVEIESAVLQAHEQILRWAFVVLVSRGTVVCLILAGVGFSVAMAVGAVATLFGAYLFARRFATRKPPGQGSLRRAMRTAYKPSLATVAMLDVFINRSPYVIAPLVLPTATAGAIAVMFNTQQGLGGLALSGLYTSMTIRSQERTDPGAQARMQVLERRLLAVAIALATASIAATPLIVSMLNLNALPWTDTAWVLLALAIPLIAWNRARQYLFLSLSLESRARTVLAAIAAPVVVVLGVGAWIRSPVVIAAAPIIGEACAMLFLHGRYGPIHRPKVTTS